MPTDRSAFRQAVPRPPAIRWFLGAGGAAVTPAVMMVAALVVVVALVIGLTEPAAATTRPDDGVDAAGPTIARVERTAALEGVVVDQDGRPFLGAIVRLHQAGDGDEPGPYLEPAFTGVDGRYRLDALAPGCYTVIVEAPAGTDFGPDDRRDLQTRCLDVGQRDHSLRSVATTTRAATRQTSPTPSATPETASAGDAEGSTTAGPSVGTAAPAPSSTSSARATSTIDVLHVGHHLGQLEPSTITLDLDGRLVDVEVGGWSRVVAAIDAARPPDAPESTITVHTGGVLGPTALSHLFGGAADADLIGQTCLDYVAPSPADRARPDDLSAFLRYLDDRHCTTEVLGGGDPAVALHPVGAGTVALVAALPAATGDGIDAAPAAIAAATRERVERLAGDGVTRIVVLSGLGLAADRALAAALPEVDAIVGSSPDALLGDLGPLGLDSAGPYPTTLTNGDGDPVCLGHAGAGGRTIGHLTVELDGAGRTVGCGGGLQLLLGRHLTGALGTDLDVVDRAAVERAIASHPELTVVDQDPATERALARWTDALDLLLDDPVATVTGDLCRTEVPGRSVGILCGPGERVLDVTGPRADAQRLVADAFRHRLTDGADSDDSDGGDDSDGPLSVALIDSGTVADAVGPGTLTTVEAYRLLPRGDRLVVLDLSGAELARTLAEGVEAALDGPTPRYPHTSGLVWKPDLSAPAGRRVGSIDVVGSDGSTPLDPTARYRVITTDSLLAPDSGYDTLRAAAADGRAAPTAVGGAEALVDYLDDVLGGLVDPTTWPTAEAGGTADDGTADEATNDG